ncbi:MAG TPA: tol-pal system protein YbgF [Pseudomonadales bacterium]
MVYSRSLKAGVLLGMASLLVAGGVVAQQAVSPAQAGGQNPDQRLSELFYQLQVLQQEVQELRGLVEEQAYQINRLARDQKEQYIDLDRRVAQLTVGGAVASGPASPPPAAPAGPTSSPSFTTTPATSPAFTAPASSAATTAAAAASTAAALPPSANEREAYQTAFDLMKGRQFDQSIAGFSRLITDYPGGQYTPNAYYWLGELYLAQQNLEQARQSFMQVINLYPDHPKVPDTLYKLGVAYHRLGDNGRATEYFNQVRAQYPQSSAAGLAASYQQELR